MASSIFSSWREASESDAVEQTIKSRLISPARKTDLESLLDSKAARSIIKYSPTKPSAVEPGAVTLVSILYDDSGSIANSGLESQIIQGDASFLGDLSSLVSEHNKEILLLRTRINGGLIHGFQRVEECKPLTLQDLPCDGDTPWFRCMYETLAATIMYAQELCAQKRQVQLLLGTVTDGGATDSPDQATLDLFHDSFLRGTSESGRNIFSAIGISPYPSARATFDRLWLETYAEGDIKAAILKLSKILVTKSKTFGLPKMHRQLGGSFSE